MENKEQIDILNNLLEINNDRIEGYDHASKETNETDLKSLFAQLSSASYKNKLELSEEITKMGGKPVEGTRNTGKLYRAWMDVKAALTNKDRKAILNSCEYGEDVAVKNYEDALKDMTAGGELYNMINNQFVTVKEGHNKIKKLRDELVKA
jgi:uncharacterized protein (TIGR02284 family)